MVIVKDTEFLTGCAGGSTGEAGLLQGVVQELAEAAQGRLVKLLSAR